MNTTHPNQKPGLLSAIAVMTLTSGIINLFWGFIASATALGTIIGVVCLPITILPTILGVFEIIYSAKLLSAQPEPVGPSPSIAVFEILTFLMGNVFSVVAGILTLIFYNDQTVKDYFARSGSGGNYSPMIVQPIPAPVVELPAQTPRPVLPEPQPAEEAGKPKHTRKTAGK
jgi:hypothetical protein